MHKKITESDLILDKYGIKRLPKLDGGITSLDLNGCTSLTSLPENLPAGITSLNLPRCTSLTSLPENLPAGIHYLELSSCNSLTSLPENLPAGITYLNLHGSTSLTSLPENLPARINYLYLDGCTSLTSLPENLPARITDLSLSRCTSLTSLPENLPARITKLSLDGCTNLIFTPELTERLQTLEANGADIRYQDHFISNAGPVAETKLELAINSYAERNPDLTRPERIKTLLNRFVTEGIEERGGNKEIVKTTSAILTAFTQDPNHLKWAEEIATAYMLGCVNQPVAGWSEICALMAIAQAPKEKKLEASKQYRVLQGVLKYLYELPADQQFNLFQAEAANSLFKEVHKKLLNEGEIDQAWQGVPKSIIFAAGAVDSFLHANNNEVINGFHLRAKEILAQTPEEVAEHFCHDVRLRTWASVAFPEQVAEIEERYKKEKYLIESVIDKKNAIANGEQEQEDDSATEEFLNKWNELKDKSEDELRQMQAILLNEEIFEINDKVRELTKALANPTHNVAEDFRSPAPELAANIANPITTAPITTAPITTAAVVGIEAGPSPEVVSVISCSPLTQMMQRVRDFFSRH